MSFEVAASAYDRYMGRFSQPLAAEFLAWAGRGDGLPVLDVGCGPGALTTRLVDAYGAEQVSAVDPSEAFVAAIRERLPGTDVVVAAAERLPFGDGTFGAAYAQLVVHFMADPVAGLAEMGRVVRRVGTVAACVWDFAEGSPIGPFWDAAHELDPSVRVEAGRPGTGPGQLVAMAHDAGFGDIADALLAVTVPMATFEEWWEPFTLGVGPAGDHVARLSPDLRERLREACRRQLPDPPFDVVAPARGGRGAR